jgi:hypothetical protein
MARNDGETPTNPIESWMKLRDIMLEGWSKAMIDVVDSDAYAEATGAMLDSYLTAAIPAQQAMERAMDPILAQLNMPSRTEVISLAKRLTNIELRLDDLDAKLDAIQSGVERVTKAKNTTAG